MLSKKNSSGRNSGFFAFIARFPLLGTSVWGIAVWFEYASMKSSVESRMATVERISPEKWDLIYRTQINIWLHRNYLTGAILILWLVYLLWRWSVAFQKHR